MAAVASETYTSTCAPIQYAAVKAFQGGIRMERYLWNVRRILRALGIWVSERLSQAEVTVAPPVGAFYVFLDFARLAERLAARGLRTSDAVCRSLFEETGVALLPGTSFCRPPHELTARLAYVDFDGTRALAAAETLPRDLEIDRLFLETYASCVLAGVDRLCEWVEQ
jgi:aspartate aminotransferase